MKPATAKIHELGQKKRSGTQEAEKEAQKVRREEEAPWALDVRSGSPTIKEKTPIEGPLVVPSHDLPAWEEEASTRKVVVDPTLDLLMEGTTTSTREPTVEVTETGCPIMVPAVKATRELILVAISDGPP